MSDSYVVSSSDYFASSPNSSDKIVALGASLLVALSLPIVSQHQSTNSVYYKQFADVTNIELTDDVPIETYSNSSNTYNFNSFEETYKKCLRALPFDESVEIDSFDYLHDILRLEKTIRADRYDSLIRFLFSKNDINLLKAILNYISTLEYAEVTKSEEELIYAGLSSNSLSLQEIALNALLSIDNYSNKDKLSGIRIFNKYLQEDLNLFLCR